MDDKKVPVITKNEAISKLRLIQSLIASRNWEDKECVVALQMGIHAIQQPEIVRCKDCRKRRTPMCRMYFSGSRPSDTWFCKDGERKDGDGE